MTLAERLQDDPFQGYAYSYPHKTAYRELDPPVALAPLWKAEDRSSLFLYLHIPFCEVRCGFCNLFTTTGASRSLVDQYLDALSRHMEATREMLGAYRFARAAVGGGTPTFLSCAELDRLFSLWASRLGPLEKGAPLSFEMSPSTVDASKLQLLKEHGVTRASMGVQSFVPTETRALGRPQDIRKVEYAISLIRSAGFPVMNLDLIYGIQGQTAESWEESLLRAADAGAEEIYLYPLYVRPLTGLHRIGRDPSDLREELYLHGRDFLCSRGYAQISMRLFRRKEVAGSMLCGEGPVYCCQEDGMVGLGAGARSYTDSLHYSTEYAVGQNGIRSILDQYCGRAADAFRHTDYGCFLDDPEKRRRYVIKSLLRNEGLDSHAYHKRFGRLPVEDIPELEELVPPGLAEWHGGRLVLTEYGMGRSDTIGPWLFSEASSRLMEEFSLV